MAILNNLISGIFEQIPDPYQSFAKFRISRNPNLGRIELQYSRDSGATWKVLVPEPPTNPQEGLALTISSNGNAEWKAPVFQSSVTPGSSMSLGSGGGYSYIDMSLYGALTLNKLFGYYVTPIDTVVQCHGMQLDLQVPSTGNNISVVLFNQTDSYEVADRIALLPAGSHNIQVLFSVPITLPSNTTWKLKVKSIGSNDPGEYLSVRLLIK